MHVKASKQAAPNSRHPDSLPSQGRSLEPRRYGVGVVDELGAGVRAELEGSSGCDLSSLRVHRNSLEPARLFADAFTRWPDIHVAPGHEHRLLHEGRHAIQQLQGRVALTRRIAGMAINDEPGLEREAEQGPTPKLGTSVTAGRGASEPVTQCYFSKLETESQVRAAAASARLAGWQVNLLVWAATAPTTDFGPLAAYLSEPARIDALWDAARRDPTTVTSPTKEQFVLPSFAHPLVFDGEPVSGTADVPSDPDDELDTFRFGLGEYSRRELRQLGRQLQARDAPHDRQRLEILGEHDPRCEVPGEHEDEEEPTDTEGSDTEDDREFRVSSSRPQAARKLLERESTLLKPHLIGQRLEQLEEASDPEQIILAKTSRKRARSEVQYRKDTSLYEPSLDVSARAALPGRPDEQATTDLRLLNNLLESGVPIEEAVKFLTTRFVVAQYRGLFYSRKSFDKQARRRHRSSSEVDRPIFSSAAIAAGPLGMSGYYYLASQSDRREDLARYSRTLQLEGRRIREQAHTLRSKPPSKPMLEELQRRKLRATQGFKPKSMADVATHIYSEKYDLYHEMLDATVKKAKTGDPLAPLFEGLPNASNPKVSTGDVPTHAARYAYGLKPYGGHEDEVLEPEYDDHGRPRHPYSGKLYASLHPLTDYGEASGPSQLVDLQNRGRTNIGKVIIPERESAFDGFMEPERVKIERKAKFPNFSGPYRSVYAEKYGLDRAQFERYWAGLSSTTPGTPARVFVEAALSKHLAMHAELALIEQANRRATESGATLVYRTGARSFGFEIPKILSGERLSDHRIAPPVDLVARVESSIGRTRVSINGNGMACYLRSLISAGRHLGVIRDDVERVVEVIAGHLHAVGLRIEHDMIDAGSLTAAEARRALNELYHFDPEVTVVMWDSTNGEITQFTANVGEHPVVMLYTPGHFDWLR